MKNEIELLGSLLVFDAELSNYKSSKELFGELKGTSIDDKIVSLKNIYIKLLQEYSADKYTHYNNKEIFDLSNNIARKIIEFEKIAKEEINNGTYGTKNNLHKTFSISNGKIEYQLHRMISREDSIDIFDGELRGDTIKKVIVKISRNADDEGYLLNENIIELNNNTLSNEIKTLKYIDSIKDTSFQTVKQKHFPILLDDFVFENRQVSVFLVTNTSDWYDFVSLKEKFKNGIPLYHACWIMERCLSALGHLHYNKMLLGNISPSGICIIPKTHNIIFTDYSFSLIDYSTKKYVGFIPNYTAPEIMNKVSPHPRTDMYSFGMCMIYILGGNVESNTLPDSFEMIPNQKVNMDGVERIRSLISTFTNKHPKSRFDDAWKLYHQLRQLRIETFGMTGFIEFTV